MDGSKKSSDRSFYSSHPFPDSSKVSFMGFSSGDHFKLPPWCFTKYVPLFIKGKRPVEMLTFTQRKFCASELHSPVNEDVSSDCKCRFSRLQWSPGKRGSASDEYMMRVSCILEQVCEWEERGFRFWYEAHQEKFAAFFSPSQVRTALLGHRKSFRSSRTPQSHLMWVRSTPCVEVANAELAKQR